MTGHSNEPVLASIRHLHDLGLLHEVRLLILRGVNDDPELLRRTAAWLAGVDPGMRVQLTGFRAHGARPHQPPLEEPARETLDALADVLWTVAPFEICTV
jgi:pyruvate formate lyase activating enzyme